MEKILCAAIHIDNGIELMQGQACIPSTGFVIGGFNHDEIRRAIRYIKYDIPNGRYVKIHDGFLTTNNRFVSRKTAAVIAFNAAQIKKETYELISDDIREI